MAEHEIAGIVMGRRTFRRLITEHAGLGATKVMVGTWPFRRPVYQLSCSCGWKPKETVPFLPQEMGFVQAHLLREPLDQHMREEYEKLRANRGLAAWLERNLP